MRDIVIFFFLLFATASVAGQGIAFENTSWQSILLKSKKENKPIFVDCTTVWCKPCKWMEQNVFSLESVGNYFNDHFINVQMDMEKGDGIELGKEYKINSYPTYLFINPDGTLIHKEGGAKKTEDFMAIARKALDSSGNLDGMNKAYDRGERSRPFLQKYIIALGKAKQMAKQKGIFESYFNSLSQQELLNQQDFEVILSAVEPVNEQFIFLLKNHEAYKKLVGTQNFDNRIYAKTVLAFSLMARKQGLEKVKEAAAYYKQYYVPAIQKAEDMTTIRWYRDHKEVGLLIDAAIRYMNDFNQEEPSSIVYFMNMVLSGPDLEEYSNSYQRAISFVERAAKKYPDNTKLSEIHEKLLRKQEGISK